MPKQLSEDLRLDEATTSTTGGSLVVEFITPGWGSSGYYSRQVVEAAAPLFAAGTHMYFDHPTASEEHERPVRSVRDLAAVITEAAVDPATGAIRGTVKPIAAYADLLTDETFAKNVGLSIRGSATDITVGEAEGRTGPIVEGLADIQSVDFVTRAGRGGRVLQVLESERFIAEATADDRARQLSDTVAKAYAGPDSYAWVTDTDAERQVVWYQVTAGDAGPRTYEQAYTVGDNDADITLTGDPVEVSRLTTYVPVNTSPAGRPTPTTESEETSMGHIQVDEAEHRRVTEAAGRVPTLESERDTAAAERDEARAELARRDRADRATALIAEAATAGGVTFTRLETRGLLTGLPVAEDGHLDEAAYKATLDEAVAEAAKTTTVAGAVRGFGESTTVTESSSRPTRTPWGRELQKGA